MAKIRIADFPMLLPTKNECITDEMVYWLYGMCQDGE